MHRIITILLFTFCLLQAPYALASTVGFGDEAITWDGYANDWRHNGMDTVGTPNLDRGNFYYEGHTLVGIDLTYLSSDGVLTPGDWFFDFDQDNTWDYVLHNDLIFEAETTYVWSWCSWSFVEVETGEVELTGSNGYALYKFEGDGLPYGNGTMDGYVESFWPDGYDGRDNHPVQAIVDGLNPLEDVAFSGWVTDGVSWYRPATSTWSDFAIDLSEYAGSTFTYAFAMTCANDVLYGESTVPTPEPSTFLLFGLGGLGVLCYARKRNRAF